MIGFQYLLFLNKLRNISLSNKPEQAGRKKTFLRRADPESDFVFYKMIIISNSNTAFWCESLKKTLKIWTALVSMLRYRCSLEVTVHPKFSRHARNKPSSRGGDCRGWKITAVAVDVFAYLECNTSMGGTNLSCMFSLQNYLILCETQVEQRLCFVRKSLLVTTAKEITYHIL